jgi:hypothetical protein
MHSQVIISFYPQFETHAFQYLVIRLQRIALGEIPRSVIVVPEINWSGEKPSETIPKAFEWMWGRSRCIVLLFILAGRKGGSRTFTFFMTISVNQMKCSVWREGWMLAEKSLYLTHDALRQVKQTTRILSSTAIEILFDTLHFSYTFPSHLWFVCAFRKTYRCIFIFQKQSFASFTRLSETRWRNEQISKSATRVLRRIGGQHMPVRHEFFFYKRDRDRT